MATEFRLDRFYRINRRLFVWVAILWLIYALRDFFALIFVTFLLSSFTLPLIDYLQRETRVPRRLIIVVTYLLITLGLAGIFWYVVPRVVDEAFGVAAELGAIQTKILKVKDDVKESYPAMAPMVDRYIDKEQVSQHLRDLATQVQPWLQKSAKLALKMVTTILLSLLFSFLIVLDLSRLSAEVRRLERSRLHDMYQESAQPVVRFAAVLARAFRAQAMIAVVNTCLTLIGFLILGLPKVALLTIIVFFFSFVPVLGVFISTVPAVLVAINVAGYGMAFGVIVLVTIIHLIEAYILNPIIYGRHLHLNPVIVLLILFAGHHFFGMWGMLLGVPVTCYFLYDVFGVPREDEGINNYGVENSGPSDPVAGASPPA